MERRALQVIRDFLALDALAVTSARLRDEPFASSIGGTSLILTPEDEFGCGIPQDAVNEQETFEDFVAVIRAELA
tara:strand:+ start:745 stop:969 length:225 start_codon:yes stop_codon:yes gene_type:complete